MRQRVNRRALATLSVVVCGGCEFLQGSTGCTLEQRPSFRITLTDSITAAPVTEPGLRAFVREATFLEELFCREGVCVGVLERPGRYDVTVVSPSYKPWVRSGVRVREGDCHVETAVFAARLQPLSI